MPIHGVVTPVLTSLAIALAGVFPTAFDPASAFVGGAPGWIYDDSNQSTLFQDASTPVTALEQPVGLQLDLSQGLVLGSELVTNGDFSNGTTGWTAGNNNTLSVVSGACKSITTSADGAYFGQSFSVVAGKTYKFQFDSISNGTSLAAQASLGTTIGNSNRYAGTTIAFGTQRTFYYVSPNTETIWLWFYAGVGKPANNYILIDNASCKKIAGNHRYQPTSANRPTWSARYNLLLATASLSTQSVTTVATNYVLYFTGAGTVALSGTATGTLSAGSNTITCTAGTLTLTVSGSVLTADLRPANQAVGLLPQYQRVNTATDYDSVGFPAGLRWNGSNSWMQNASVDFSGTNKVSVFVGARKQTDTGAGCLVGTSADAAANNGAFVIYAPDGTKKYEALSRGTTAVAISTLSASYAAPITNVLQMSGDISAPSIALYANSVSIASSSSSQGTGNYGNYPTYFGATGGTSLFFNGLTFSNVCIGIALSASQIAAFEAWTNARCRAYV